MLTGRLAQLLHRLRGGARSVRRPFWVAGAAAVVAGAVALSLVPPGGPPPPSTPSTAAAESASAGAGEGVAAASAADRAVGGEDPAAAAVVLLELRERCFRELSVLCLDAVAQPDSSAHHADTAAILAAQESGELAASAVLRPGKAEIVERLGDSALVRVLPAGDGNSEPASVLMIRTEAGWRIRGLPGAAAQG